MSSGGFEGDQAGKGGSVRPGSLLRAEKMNKLHTNHIFFAGGEGCVSVFLFNVAMRKAWLGSPAVLKYKNTPLSLQGHPKDPCPLPNFEFHYQWQHSCYLFYQTKNTPFVCGEWAGHSCAASVLALGLSCSLPTASRLRRQ